MTGRRKALSFPPLPALPLRQALTATLGPRAVFRRVHIHGTQRVDPRLIALHTGIRAGAPYRPSDVDDARGQIYNLGRRETNSNNNPLLDALRRLPFVNFFLHYFLGVAGARSLSGEASYTWLRAGRRPRRTA